MRNVFQCEGGGWSATETEDQGSPATKTGENWAVHVRLQDGGQGAGLDPLCGAQQGPAPVCTHDSWVFYHINITFPCGW